MLRYLRSRIGGSYEIKNDDLDDFISYTKLTVHGYPQKVSCFDFDEKTGLLAIGTRNGRLIIYYPNGAQIQSTIGGNSQIIAIYYFTDTNSLILLCNVGSKKDAQQFFRYQIIGDQMHSTRLDQEVHLKRITCCEVLPMNEDANSALLIGTKSGNIYALRVRNMELTEFLVFLDTSLSGVDELNKLPNSIDGILIHPKEFSKLFLLFNHSILIYYDKVHDSILRKFISSNEITHFSLGPDANSMFFSQTDGIYSILDVENGNHEVKKTFGGDVDCVKTTKIISSASLNDEQFIIFSGGIPDTLEYQNTITIFCGDKSLILDFDSDIIDFKIYERKEIAHALFVLCEDEFVAIDLRDPLWRMFHPPYLYPIHSSPITCISAISGLSADAFLLLDRIGKEQRIASKIYSKNSWPLENQNSSKRNAEKQPKDLLLIITGHENGFVNIWLANNLSFQLWLQCNTARDFEGYKEEEYIGLTEDGRRNEEEKAISSSNLLPPVRKAGIFDPFSDDFRLCIQRIHFDNVSGQFAVGGQAGQLMVYEGMAKEKIVPANELFLLDMTESSTADEIIANSNRATRNDSAIQPRSSPAKFPPGFSLIKNTIGQFKPPIPITAICWNSNNEILAAGNEFGYAILGLNRREIFLIKTLISSSDVVQISSKDCALSRFKSVKKSIRQSFRRKKKPNPDREEFGDKELTRFNRGEREIVQRRPNPNALDGETPNSLVKMLSFKHCNLFPLNTNYFETFLFVGTHGGNVFIHALHHHQMDQRREEIASEECCPLIKEIRMQHQAPIIAIECLQFGHTVRLIIISEEQIRSFILPTLKPSNIKYRFTAVEGSRIKKAVLVQLTSRVRRIRNPEKFLAITTNRGEVFLIHPSNPKKPYRVQFTQPNDSAGVLSSVITSDGQLFYLKPGGSEFNRSSLCGNITAKQCQN